MFFIAALLLVAAPATKVYAGAPDRHLPYAFGSTIEVQGGWAGAFYSLNGESKCATGLDNGVDFSLRYTYFFNRHIGAFVSGGIGATNSNYEKFFGVANRADGNKYTYDFSDHFHYSYEEPSPYVLAGLAYRYDFGAWSLRPRIGVGVDWYAPAGGISYRRYDRNSSDKKPTYYEYVIEQPKKDYLENPDDYHYCESTLPCFAAFAGIQMTYSMRNHMFISLEAGAKGILSHGKAYYNIYDSKPAYNPTNWAEAVYDSYRIGTYDIIPESVRSIEVPNKFIGILNVSVGFGWNIGWNRNERGFYKK